MSSRPDMGLRALFCLLLLGAGGPVQASDAGIPNADLGGFPPPVQAAVTEARGHLEEALAEPGSPDRLALAWGQYGDVLFVHELLAQARQAYARARSLQPDN